MCVVAWASPCCLHRLTREACTRLSHIVPLVTLCSFWILHSATTHSKWFLVLIPLLFHCVTAKWFLVLIPPPIPFHRVTAKWFLVLIPLLFHSIALLRNGFLFSSPLLFHSIALLQRYLETNLIWEFTASNIRIYEYYMLAAIGSLSHVSINRGFARWRFWTPRSRRWQLCRKWSHRFALCFTLLCALLDLLCFVVFTKNFLKLFRSARLELVSGS
jgi:hypothetical protein